MTPGQVTELLLQRSTTRASTGSNARYSKPSETSYSEGRAVDEIPIEAHRVLTIWGNYKRKEGGAVTLGYPRHSAGFSSGGASTEDSFEEMVEAADRRTGAIADAILDEMSLHGYARQVLAIWNRYLGDVARFRGDPAEILIDGCRSFLIEAKKRGIAV
jgi:hypothetical protein